MVVITGSRHCFFRNDGVLDIAIDNHNYCSFLGMLSNGRKIILTIYDLDNKMMSDINISLKEKSTKIITLNIIYPLSIDFVTLRDIFSIHYIERFSLKMYSPCSEAKINLLIINPRKKHCVSSNKLEWSHILSESIDILSSNCVISENTPPLLFSKEKMIELAEIMGNNMHIEKFSIHVDRSMEETQRNKIFEILKKRNGLGTTTIRSFIIGDYEYYILDEDINEKKRNSKKSAKF